MCAGVPLAVALGLAGTAVIAYAHMGMMSVPINLYGGIAKYPLLAIPVFILAGLVFERTGVVASMVKFAASIVGKRRGGLAVAIGAFTPPTAVNLMVTCRIAGIPLQSTFYWTLWMVFAMTAVLLLLTFVPEISLFLPRALGYL